MKKTISVAIAGALLAVTAIVPVTTASAQSSNVYAGFNDRNDQWRWKRHNNRWNQPYAYRHHRPYYGHGYNYYHHDHDNNFAPFAAGAIFGLATGAIVGGVAGSVGDDSYYRCEARYRSFDPGSWTYLGYDGDRHYCRL